MSVVNGVCTFCGAGVIEATGEHIRDDLPPCYGRPLKFVRWKRYGFTHIIKDEAQRTTLCGNWWHGFDSTFKLSYPNTNEQKLGLKRGDPDPRKLAPSDTDDGKRPLCGACKKIAKL